MKLITIDRNGVMKTIYCLVECRHCQDKKQKPKQQRFNHPYRDHPIHICVQQVDASTKFPLYK